MTASTDAGQLKKAVQSEIRRLQKALVPKSCLKVALAEEMCNKIDFEDVASVVCKLLARAIQNLYVSSTSAVAVE